MKNGKKLLRTLPLVILVPILIVSLTILTDSYLHPDEVPSFLGWKPLIVFSDSMEPVMSSGDIAVVKEVDAKKLKANDIVAVKDRDLVITQRIVSVSEEHGTVKFKIKSDKSDTDDQQYVSADKIEGKYQFRVGLLGSIAMFIQSPIGTLASLSLPIGMLLTTQANESSDDNKEKQNKNKQKTVTEVKPRIIEELEIEVLDEYEDLEII